MEVPCLLLSKTEPWWLSLVFGSNSPPTHHMIALKVVVSVEEQGGNLYLDMECATESEMADTEGSTVTGAPL
jgi:hypothetical protein